MEIGQRGVVSGIDPLSWSAVRSLPWLMLLAMAACGDDDSSKAGPPIALPEPTPPSERRGWAVLAHLLGPATLFLGPLAISRGRHGRFVREHALEAANFQLTYLLSCIAVPIAAIFTLGVGVLLWIPLVAGWLGYSIAGAIAAGRGREFRYPLNLRLIRS